MRTTGERHESHENESQNSRKNVVKSRPAALDAIKPAAPLQLLRNMRHNDLIIDPKPGFESSRDGDSRCLTYVMS